MEEVRLPARHGISRARLFIQLAEECESAEKDKHEAFLDAAIIFSRSAMNRLQRRYEGCHDWNDWFTALNENASANFIRTQRDFILKQNPLMVSQVIHMGSSPTKAKHLYYFEDKNETAIDTITGHVDEIEKLIRQGEMKFGTDGIIRA